MSGKLYFFSVLGEILYSFLVYLGMLQMFYSLDKSVWFTTFFLPLKESPTLFQTWFFCYTFTYFLPFGVIENGVTRVNSKIFNGNFDHFVSPGWSILFLHAQAHKAWLFTKFLFELDASSYSFKSTYIPGS